MIQLRTLLAAANMTRNATAGYRVLDIASGLWLVRANAAIGEKAVLKGRYYGVTGVLTY
jgi:hypothetical protein